MTVHDVFAASNVLIVAGKGGVGKTTVGASLAFAAAHDGYHVLLIELEGYSNLGPSLDLPEIGHEPTRVTTNVADPSTEADELEAGSVGRLEVMQLKPDEALADYLDRSGLGPIIRRFSRSEAVEVVSAAAPGIRDLVTMGKIRQLEEANVADLIVVDAPASGHAISLLTSAAGMADSTTSGPIKEQADQVLAMLSDDTRCQVVLVTLAEETPVTETVETAFALEEEVGIKLGPVVVNALWPPIEGLQETVADFVASGGDDGDPRLIAGLHRLSRIEAQQQQVGRLDQELPLAQIHLPYLFTASIGLGEISTLAHSFDEPPS